MESRDQHSTWNILTDVIQKRLTVLPTLQELQKRPFTKLSLEQINQDGKVSISKYSASVNQSRVSSPAQVRKVLLRESQLKKKNIKLLPIKQYCHSITVSPSNSKKNLSKSRFNDSNYKERKGSAFKIDKKFLNSQQTSVIEKERDKATSSIQQRSFIDDGIKNYAVEDFKEMPIIVVMDGNMLKKSSLKQNQHYCHFDLREFLVMLLPRNKQSHLNRSLNIFQLIKIFNPPYQVVAHAFLQFMTQVNCKLNLHNSKVKAKYCYMFDGTRVSSLVDLNSTSRILIVSNKKQLTGLKNLSLFLKENEKIQMDEGKEVAESREELQKLVNSLCSKWIIKQNINLDPKFLEDKDKYFTKTAKSFILNEGQFRKIEEDENKQIQLDQYSKVEEKVFEYLCYITALQDKKIKDSYAIRQIIKSQKQALKLDYDEIYYQNKGVTIPIPSPDGAMRIFTREQKQSQEQPSSPLNKTNRQILKTMLRQKLGNDQKLHTISGIKKKEASYDKDSQQLFNNTMTSNFLQSHKMQFDSDLHTNKNVSIQSDAYGEGIEDQQEVGETPRIEEEEVKIYFQEALSTEFLNKIQTKYELTRQLVYNLHSMFASMMKASQAIIQGDEPKGKKSKKMKKFVTLDEEEPGIPLGFFQRYTPFIHDILPEMQLRFLQAVGIDIYKKGAKVTWEQLLELYCIIELGNLEKDRLINFWCAVSNFNLTLQFLNPTRDGFVQKSEYMPILEKLVRGRMLREENQGTQFFATCLERKWKRLGCLDSSQTLIIEKLKDAMKENIFDIQIFGSAVGKTNLVSNVEEYKIK